MRYTLNVDLKKRTSRFSDASQQGYGACVYVRSELKSGKVVMRLLTSKSVDAEVRT